MANNILNINIIPKLNLSALTDIQKRINKVLGKETSIDIEVDVDDNDVKKSFSKITKDADDYGSKAGKSFGSSFTSFAKKALAGAAIFSVLAVGAAAVKNATSEFKDFNSELQNVESLGVKNVEALGTKINELSKKTIDTTSNLTAAAYQSVSAGITGSQEQLVGFIEQASKVAVAGNATTEAAVDSLTSVMNSYKLEITDAGKVSDIFFGAIKGGKTDFNQLNSSLSNVLPAAAAAGVSFSEVAGNLAQMTALGTPTAQATTQLRAAIVEIQKPGKDLAEVMSGVTVEIGGVKQTLTENNIAQVLKQQGLTATLQQIEQSATASGKSMTQVFSSTEAAGAALLLTGENAATANEQLKNINKGIEEGVSTDAFESQFKSLDNQMKLVKNNLQAGFNTIFAALLPVVNNLLQTIIPILSQLFDAITPIIEELASIIGPLLNNVMTLIQPLITLLAEQLAPLLTSIIGKIVGLIGPLAELFAPIFEALSAVYEQIAPVLEQFYTILTDGIGEAIRGLVPLITLLATTLGGILGDVLELVLGLFVEIITNNLDLINVVVELINALLPVVQVVLQLAAALVKLAVGALKPLLPIIADVIGLVAVMTKEIIGAVLAVAEFFGLIEDEKPEAPFKKTTEAAKETTKEVAAMNAEIVNPEATKTTETHSTNVKKTGTAHKENKKLVTEYFNAFKKGQDEMLRMAKLEDEITRIREERTKSTADEIVEQRREIDALLDYRNKLAQSLKDGFLINEAGNKINLTAEERIDLTKTLANLDSDLKFASKELDKLTVEVEIDKKQAEREAKATIAELQRERLELEVEMGVKPKTALLDAYKKDLLALNLAITGAETVEQEKLLNDKLKKLKQIKDLENQLNEDAAEKAAQAYQNSFNAVIDNFQSALDGAFEVSKPDNSRIDAIEKEIEAIDDRKSALIKDYRDGILSAQQYNSKLVEIESERVKKVEELNTSQYNSFKILADGLAKAFTTVSDQYSEMAKINLQKLSELSKKETEYQELQAQGVEIPAELKQAHEDYGNAASNAINQMAISAGSAFASMLLEGGNVAKGLAQIALDSLDAIIPVLVAQIFGQALAQLGPIGGALAAAAGIATLKGLVAIAKSSIGGAETGVYNLSKANKGNPGATDSIPMMLAPGESVASAKASRENPFYKMNIKYGMNEDEYFTKFKLKPLLDKYKISMPSMGLSVLPAELNDKAYKQLQVSMKNIELLDETYKRIDKEKLAVAVQKDSQASAELKKQNQLLQQMIVQNKADNISLKEEITSLRRDFKHNTNVELKGNMKVKGEDLEAAIVSRNRKKVY